MHAFFCVCVSKKLNVPSSCTLPSWSFFYWQEEAEGEIEREAREERDRQRILRAQKPETKFDMVSLCV